MFSSTMQEPTINENGINAVPERRIIPTVNQRLVENLDDFDRAIWDKIATRKGTVVLNGDVGVSKSATIKSIADTLGMKYIRKDLATMDESDLAGVPREVVDPVTNIKYIKNLMQEYVLEAINSTVPVILVLEEVNRCNELTMAAALGFINERIVCGVTLPDHVYIVAAVNMGPAYESETKNMGLAMNNRFIWVNFKMPFNLWCERFANDNLNRFVLSYLKSSPGEANVVFDKLKGDELAFATYRSWTNLSAFLDQFDTLDKVHKAATNPYGGAECYIGDEMAGKFKIFLENMTRIKPTQILNEFENIESIVAGLSQPEKIALLNMFEDDRENVFNLNGLTTKQHANFEKFMLYNETETLMAFIQTIGSRLISESKFLQTFDKKDIPKFFTNLKNSKHESIRSLVGSMNELLKRSQGVNFIKN